MSIYRKLLIAAATMVLSSYVFAADDAATTTTTTTTETTAPAATDATDATAPAATAEKVDLNKATAKDLMKVKGLNSAKAKAIVKYRKKHGDFKSVDDLKSVNGFKKMKEEKMKEIQDQLTVG